MQYNIMSRIITVIGHHLSVHEGVSEVVRKLLVHKVLCSLRKGERQRGAGGRVSVEDDGKDRDGNVS